MISIFHHIPSLNHPPKVERPLRQLLHWPQVATGKVGGFGMVGSKDAANFQVAIFDAGTMRLFLPSISRAE
jgi:hypothetical protein